MPDTGAWNLVTDSIAATSPSERLCPWKQQDCAQGAHSPGTVLRGAGCLPAKKRGMVWLHQRSSAPSADAATLLQSAPCSSSGTPAGGQEGQQAGEVSGHSRPAEQGRLSFAPYTPI